MLTYLSCYLPDGLWARRRGITSATQAPDLVLWGMLLSVSCQGHSRVSGHLHRWEDFRHGFTAGLFHIGEHTHPSSPSVKPSEWLHRELIWYLASLIELLLLAHSSSQKQSFLLIPATGSSLC